MEPDETLSTLRFSAAAALIYVNLRKDVDALRNLARPNSTVPPDGAIHQWRKDPPRK